MSNYQRLFIKGGTYFFTVVTAGRKPLLCQEQAIHRLKASFRYAMKKHPYRMSGLVILPDHLHCIWHLPKDDDNFSVRWNLIKRYFSIGMAGKENHRREKNIWQRRFWEHLIRDEKELNQYLDYIHYNPVKHGHVTSPNDWAYSTFKYFANKGSYDLSWGCGEEPKEIRGLILE